MIDFGSQLSQKQSLWGVDVLCSHISSWGCWSFKQRGQFMQVFNTGVEGSALLLTPMVWDMLTPFHARKIKIMSHQMLHILELWYDTAWEQIYITVKINKASLKSGKPKESVLAPSVTIDKLKEINKFHFFLYHSITLWAFKAHLRHSGLEKGAVESFKWIAQTVGFYFGFCWCKYVIVSYESHIFYFKCTGLYCIYKTLRPWVLVTVFIFILWKQFNTLMHVTVQDQSFQILKHYD